MTVTDRNWMHLCDEHGRVIREYGRAQQRASDVMGEQARRIDALEAQVMQLRAAVMIRETALAWARGELEAVRTAIPGMPKRLALAQQVRMLEARIQSMTRGESTPYRRELEPVVQDPAGIDSPGLNRKVVLWISQDPLRAAGIEPAITQAGVRLVRADRADAQNLDAGLADADLVICQAGCVSHGDWWRVKDYCSRTGKQCVLVEQPDALERVIASRAQALVGTGK